MSCVICVPVYSESNEITCADWDCIRYTREIRSQLTRQVPTDTIVDSHVYIEIHSNIAHFVITNIVAIAEMK